MATAALFTIAIVALAVTGLFQEQIRRQVEAHDFGPHEVSPWSVRYRNGLPWRRHKEFYPDSKLRVAFVAASFTAVFATATLVLVLTR